MRRWSCMLALLTCLIQLARTQDADTNEVLVFRECRLTVNKDYKLLFCEEQDECAAQNPSSTVQCSKYLYKQLTLEDCQSKCCPDQDNLSADSIRECRDGANLQFALYIIIIIVVIFAIVGVLVGLLATYVFGFQKNPYNSKRVWVGCCCCKRKYQFKPDREEALGPDGTPQSDRRMKIQNDVNILNQREDRQNEIMDKEAFEKKDVKL